MAEPRQPDGPAIAWPNMRAEILYERFKQQIIDRKWLPGAQLNIDRLARDYDVSITPVREALARLSSDRLVVAAAHRGYTVAPPPSAERMADLLTVRLLLEPHAARGAAIRGDQEDLQTLREVQAAIAEQGAGSDYEGMQAYSARNQIFHERIFEANANDVLTEIYRHSNYHVLIGHVYHSAGVTDLGEVVAEHEAILAALTTHDPDAAETAMRVHIERGTRRLLALYRSPEPVAMSRSVQRSPNRRPARAWNLPDRRDGEQS